MRSPAPLFYCLALVTGHGWRGLSSPAVPCLILSALLLGLTACAEEPSRPPVPTLASPAGVADTEAGGKNNMGVSHLEMRHYEISEGYFRDAIALRPDFAEAWFNLGVALDGIGKHDEATEAFRKAKQFGATNPQIAGSDMLKKRLGL
jgi:tetratricopeptide (TPR) repeat protein